VGNCRHVRDVALTTEVDLLSTLDISLSNGGTAGFFLGYIVSFFGLSLVYLSISEMSSMSVRPQAVSIPLTSFLGSLPQVANISGLPFSPRNPAAAS
jgi:hypothetical protein